MTVIEQQSFDIDLLLAEVNPEPPRPAYAGRAPLRFTPDVFMPHEFREAEEELRQAGHGFGIHVGWPHIWHSGFQSSVATPDHAFVVLLADLGCEDYGKDSHRFAAGRCFCVGDQVYRGICECGWASDIYSREDPAIAAWHDHAWPGWRDLPVMPKDVRPIGGGITTKAKAAMRWVADYYPPNWGKPGAPVVTEREGFGTRSVSGYSPWGGYDIGSAALERRAA